MYDFIAKEMGAIQLRNMPPVTAFIHGRDRFRTHGLYDSKSPSFYPLLPYIIVCSLIHKRERNLHQD